MKSLLVLVIVSLLAACGQTESKKPASAVEQNFGGKGEPIPPTQQRPLPLPTPAPNPTQPQEPQPIPQQPQEPTPQPTPVPGPVGNQCPTGPVGNGGVCGPIIVGGPVVRVPMPGVPQDCYKVSPFICDMENAVLGLINGFRNAQGIAPLAGDFQIAFASRDWSFAQVSVGQVAPPDLSRAITIMGMEFGGAIFNPALAGGSAVLVQRFVPTVVGDAQRIFNVMMNDPAMATNVINPTFRAAGVGIVIAGPNTIATVIFAQ